MTKVVDDSVAEKAIEPGDRFLAVANGSPFLDALDERRLQNLLRVFPIADAALEGIAENDDGSGPMSPLTPSEPPALP